MQLVDLGKREVKKHVAAIHINGKLSLLHRKLSNVLLWNAYDQLKVQEKHRIRIRDLAYLVGFDSNDLQMLKDALRGLAEMPLEWNILHEDGEEEWGVASMLSQAVIRGGYCSYSYSPDLREKFYNPEMYARINLGIQRDITTGYALTLYENCARFRNVGFTGWIELNDVRKLFGVDDSAYYSTFKHFNSKILKPSVEVVNKYSDILIAVELRREKQRVSAVRFLIKENPQLSIWAKKPPPELQQLADPTAPAEEEGPVPSGTRDRLLSFGLGEGSVDRYLQAYSEDYLNGNLDVVERDFQAGKIKDLPRYTAAALNGDYRPKESRFEAAAKKQKQLKKAAAERQKITPRKAGSTDQRI